MYEPPILSAAAMLTGCSTSSTPSSQTLWVAGGDTADAVAEFNNSGVSISPAGGYADPAFSGDFFYPSLTADASGHVWWDDAEFVPGGAVLTNTG